MSWAVRGPYPLDALMFWVAWEGTRQIGRLCAVVTDEHVTVGTVFVEEAYRRQGISSTLHETAYLWARANGRTFWSGVINGPENLAYWVRLSKQGRARVVATEHGEMYERTG